MCTSRAPASNISCTIFFEVVPRTTLSSISTIALAADDAGVGRVLELDAERADALLGLDEGAADVVVADDAELERHARFLREADGGGTPESGIGTMTSASAGASRASCDAHLLADVVDGAAADDGVGAGEIDVFEDARARRAQREGAVALDAVGGDDDDLAVLDLAHELGADDVERAGLRGEHVGRRRAGRAPAGGCRRDRGRRSACRWSGRRGRRRLRSARSASTKRSTMRRFLRARDADGG